ncbi:MAG: metalloregulator ArsR/SmtB family transcription factor [Deltaproteobacteria bacterium]|nr:metalloregulator ArsR/SmtB family transcription factor [Deltaproteobacteria bacterium]
MGSSAVKRGAAATEKLVYIDAASVRAARSDMPGDRMVKALAETFRALSDPTRVRIISVLAGQELCVFDLSRMLGITGSAVSHQLRLLRGQRLVKYRKEGKEGKVAYYSLDDDHIRNLMEECIKHVRVG